MALTEMSAFKKNKRKWKHLYQSKKSILATSGPVWPSPVGIT